MKDKRVLIIYKNDDGTIAKTYTSHFGIKGDLIYFTSDNNKIILPTSRLLKIKEGLKSGGDNGDS